MIDEELTTTSASATLLNQQFISQFGKFSLECSEMIIGCFILLSSCHFGLDLLYLLDDPHDVVVDELPEITGIMVDDLLLFYDCR